jgi:hypothetical protein
MEVTMPQYEGMTGIRGKLIGMYERVSFGFYRLKHLFRGQWVKAVFHLHLEPVFPRFQSFMVKYLVKVVDLAVKADQYPFTKGLVS